MATCAACGHENADEQKFCGECGTPLAAPRRPVAEERKVVTSLFCDLVGFTATSESADPEDVNAMLAAYFAMAKKQIEVYGGTVEKFIGDAVVGVFGVPAAHEDDPERAVRAGLAIVHAAEGLVTIGDEPLRLRVGVNTGEALVRLGAIPGAGEGMLAGDAINTASRLQSVAPEMGVAVGLGTYEATERIFEYAELEPASLKGKTEPVRVFWARAPRARFGTDVTRSLDTPLVGREIDLAILKGVFEKAVISAAPQLVAISGEPGVGKSRLVAELSAYVDDRPGALITWRQGRCLPYGDAITFWALGEIVKAHAGILESDPPGTVHLKLEAMLPAGPEREWFRQRLLPLLGIEATSQAEREELFTAWRRFFEHLAEQDPTVLIFEDLHWADPALLEFLGHLADRTEGVPLLIIGTARPELFERHPEFGRGLRNTTSINLAPLSGAETTRLVCALLQTPVLPVEVQTPILERSGGNPLYAEEFVRLMKDRGLLTKDGASWQLVDGAEIPFPDTVQALIAARLDTLSPERKALLADAAVIGKVFWAGAVAAMSGRSVAEVTEAMYELSHKELVRAARQSSMAGETEYAFSHALARDVAYAQIPRASRASRHVAAARWIEAKAPDRLEDLADMLAYHYTSAMDLSTAAGQATDDDVRDAALRFLTLAGERALGLDTSAALDSFERALHLTPVGHPARPEALTHFGEAAVHAGRFSDAGAALEEAMTSFRAQGEKLLEARTMLAHSAVLQRRNDPRSSEVASQALALLEPLPRGPQLIDALADVAGRAAFGGRPEEGMALAERALAVAADLGLEQPARALGIRGAARATLGDAGGLDDSRAALALAIQSGQGRTAATLYNNLGVDLRNYVGPPAALELLEAGLAFTTSRGLGEQELALRTTALTVTWAAGDLDGAFAAAADLTAHAENSGDEFDLIEIRAVQALVLSYRGRVLEAAELLQAIESASRRAGTPDDAAIGLGSVAVANASLGETATAARILEEIESTVGLDDAAELAFYLPPIVRAAVAIGRRDLGERLDSHLVPRYPGGEHAHITITAALAEAGGQLESAVDRYRDAAARWEAFGAVPEQGFALLGLGRCLCRLDSAEAQPALLEAHEIFSRLEMRPSLAETDTLLAQATALTS